MQQDNSPAWVVLVRYLLRTARRDVRIALGVAGAVGIYYRDPLVAEGLIGILVVLASCAAVIFGLWCIGGIAWGARPLIRFRSMAGQADQLAAEFGACAEGGDDRPRFIAAVEKAHRMRGELGALGVYMSVTDTDSDHPSTVAGAAKDNRDELRRLAVRMHEGDLKTARWEDSTHVSVGPD